MYAQIKNVDKMHKHKVKSMREREGREVFTKRFLLHKYIYVDICTFIMTVIWKNGGLTKVSSLLISTRPRGWKGSSSPPEFLHHTPALTRPFPPHCQVTSNQVDKGSNISQEKIMITDSPEKKKMFSF